MRTYRGIVCEKKNKYMVFLTEKGEFLRGVPIGDPPEVGEEAEFKLVAPSFISKAKAKPRFAGAVLVAAVLLFFVVSTVSPLNEKVMAYVQLEAGAAMEFGVDRKGNVISLRYLNETLNDPDRLSAWEGHPLLAVLDNAIIELSENDKHIIVTTIYPTEENKRKTSEKIGNTMQEVRSKHEELNLEIVESTPEERTVADKKNMSIHQFKSNQNEESFNRKQPASGTDSIEEKPVQEQKPKNKTTPSEPEQKEKGRSTKSDERQGSPAEKSDKKPNENRSEKVPPHADKKGPPTSPPGLNKQNNGNQGNQSNPEKGKPGDEKPVNEKKAGSGPPF